MAVIAVRVDGADRLRRTMKQAGVDITELKDAHRQAATTVLNAARPTTPIGPRQGGHIKSSLRVGVTTKAGIVRAGSKRQPYGGVLHYGNPRTKQEAQPWLHDAAQATESTWVAMYKSKLENILSQIEGR